MKVTFERGCMMAQLVVLVAIAWKVFALPPGIDPELRWLLAYNAATTMTLHQAEQMIPLDGLSKEENDEQIKRVKQRWARALYIMRKIDKQAPYLNSEQLSELKLKMTEHPEPVDQR